MASERGSDVRKTFEEAENNSPIIVFTGGTESITFRHEEKVEHRVMLQLFALVNGLEAPSDVIVVIAAETQLPVLQTAADAHGYVASDIASLPQSRRSLNP